MSADRPTGGVMAVLGDLIFETRIRSTAQALGIETAIVRSLDDLDVELDRVHPCLVFVDLNTAGVQAVKTARRHGVRPYVVAFVSHVDRDLAEEAAAAGADQVLHRSRFSAELPRILQTHCPPA